MPNRAFAAVMVACFVVVGADVSGNPVARAEDTSEPKESAVGVAVTLASAKRMSAAVQEPARCDDWNTEAFFRTATADDIATCLVAGADVTATTEDGHTPLHHAAWYGEDPVVVQTLLAAGADMWAPATDDGHTPVHEAAGNESPTVIQAFLAAGADVETRTATGQTLLRYAVENNGNPALIQVLLAAGADLRTRQDRGWSHLHAAASNSESPAIVEALIAAGSQVEARDEDGDTPLIEAAWGQPKGGSDRSVVGGSCEHPRAKRQREKRHSFRRPSTMRIRQ